MLGVGPLTARVTFGLAIVDHEEPFHRSMSVRHAPPEPDRPTAKHTVAVGHETPANDASVAPAGFGLATADQVAPFGRSTSVTTLPAAFVYCPTPKHFVAVAHDTPASEATDGAGIAGG